MGSHTFKVFKLHFTTPLHISNEKDDYGISLKSIESDTMYAAITATLDKLGEKIPANGDLGCCISSLFPFYQRDKDSDAVLFFPKPLKQPLINIPDSTLRKLVKKISWMDKEYFEKHINGTSINVEEDTKNIAGEFLLKDKSILPNNGKFISSQVDIHARVDRKGEDTRPYYMDRLYFKDYSGLYFLAEGDTALIEKALDLLQHEGIGTDRNVGNGTFEYTIENVTLQLPTDNKHIMSLSAFIPESKEQLDEMIKDIDAAYNFKRRGGWITTPPFNKLRKNYIYAFTASSVFKSTNNSIHTAGCIVDLNPEISFTESPLHPIWRCGKSIFIPFKL